MHGGQYAGAATSGGSIAVLFLNCAADCSPQSRCAALRNELFPVTPVTAARSALYRLIPATRLHRRDGYGRWVWISL
jgi:hypothetical protein